MVAIGMKPLPSFEDLRLVLAVGRRGSVGSAARDLQISQPSASQRLARLEQLVGVRLFERDSRGARPTAAGLKLISQAEHILGHLDGVYDVTRAADASTRLAVGTTHSLAAAVFPVLDAQLEGFVVDQRIDHEQRLIELAAEGTLDAAFVCIPDGVLLPRDAVVRAVGQDELVLFLPAGVALEGSAADALRGAVVVFATYGESSDAIRSEILSLGGAAARLAVTPPTAIVMARRRRQPAAVPRSTIPGQLLPGERVVDAPFRHRRTISVVSGQNLARPIANALRDLGRALGLRPVRRRDRSSSAT
jgi:DNA-binding transcriptional LysR family regulator